MKKCELCKSPAKLYCESDQANLCWPCDEKVHSANFLVAKHVRRLCCNICQTPMSWTASGVKLGRTISLCELCIKFCNKKERRQDERERVEEESEGDNDEEFESGSDFSDSDDSDDEEEDEDDDLIEEEEECDNQVVPWSSKLSSPPPAVSSSDSEVLAEDHIDISLKLKQSPADLNYQNKLETSSKAASSCIAGDDCESSRPFKFRKLEANRLGTRKTGLTIREEAVEKSSRALYLDLNEYPSTN